MPSIIFCDCNAGMERVFLSRTPLGDSDISRNVNYNIYFDMHYVGTPFEQRYIRVLDPISGVVLQTIPLNDAGGAKPMNGDIAPHMPTSRPNLKADVPCDIEQERVFFAEENLSSDPAINVELRIIPATDIADMKRVLFFDGNVHARLKGKEIRLNDKGGKKPLGGGLEFFFKDAEDQLEFISK